MVKALVAVALLGALWSASASAACMQDQWGQVICGAGQCTRDREGEVYCAPTRYGSAVRTSDGQVKCAPGQCVRNLRGDVICSDIDGGGAVKLMDGTARCEGACVQATTELCEYTPAGR